MDWVLLNSAMVHTRYSLCKKQALFPSRVWGDRSTRIRQRATRARRNQLRKQVIVRTQIRYGVMAWYVSRHCLMFIQLCDIVQGQPLYRAHVRSCGRSLERRRSL
jgi:hypothetical protein